MSRYDYQGPGTDSAYCDGLASTVPAECSVCHATFMVDVDAPSPLICSERCERLTNSSIDPAERAAHSVIDALGTLEVELAKVNDLDRAWQLRRLIQSVYQQADRVSHAAADKVDSFVP